jgi:hypothetical protein
MDLRGWVAVLREISVCGPAGIEANVPGDVPKFVSEMIEVGLSYELIQLSSFRDVFETVK